MSDELGSIPLRERDEKFSRLIANVPGISLTDAWCQSVVPNVEPTPGRRVSASKAAKRCADRIAFLKRARSAAEAPTEGLTATRLASLMEETTHVLMGAVQAAQSAGAASMAQQLRKIITTHAGRSQRLDTRTPDIPDPGPEIPVADYMRRLFPCRCPS